MSDATMTRREAGQQLRGLMEAGYEGRSVRTPEEFRRDLRALRIAADLLDPPDAPSTCRAALHAAAPYERSGEP